MEEWIKNNRAAFDDQPLPEGHAQRFAARMEAGRLIAKRRRMVVRLSSAAGIAAAALVALVVVLRAPGSDCRLDAELADVNAYYGAMVDDGVARVEQAARGMTPEARRDLMESVAQMQLQTRELLGELCRSNAPAQTAEQILIGHYQSQIAALQNINI